MTRYKWEEISADDVVKAIEIFDSEETKYPKSRTTFLLYGGREYPAKHIRGMAYNVHFGVEINKGDFSGGQETVRFFEKLGFDHTETVRNAFELFDGSKEDRLIYTKTITEELK